MAKTIRLEVVSPERLVFQEDVKMVIARTTGGDIGVLPGHAPLLAGLEIWPVRVMRASGIAFSPSGSSLSAFTACAPIICRRRFGCPPTSAR